MPDFLKIDETCLTEEELMLRDLVRQYAAKEAAPHIRNWDAGKFAPYATHEELIRDQARKMGKTLGLFGATFKDLGRYLPGENFEPISQTAYGIALRELEYVDTCLRSLISGQSALSLFAVYSFGSEEQKKKWLPLLYRGEKLGCFGLTESHGGSDPANIKTSATKTSAGWLLRGNKVWITNGFADVAIVWAKTKDGIRGFLVEKGTKGFSFRNEEKWALRGGVASTLSFDNCEILDAALMPGTEQAPGGKDLSSALRCIAEGRFGICWGAVGAGRACIDEALEFSKTRVLFGKPLAARQETQRKLAWMTAASEQAQLLMLHLSKLKETGALEHFHVSLAKQQVVSQTLEIAQLSVEILSADVFTFDAFNAGRHLRNMYVVKKYEGTHEVHWLNVGRALTGVSAF